MKDKVGMGIQGENLNPGPRWGKEGVFDTPTPNAFIMPWLEHTFPQETVLCNLGGLNHWCVAHTGEKEQESEG